MFRNRREDSSAPALDGPGAHFVLVSSQAHFRSAGDQTDRDRV